MRGFNHRKTAQSLNYFAIQNGGELNKMKGLKLIWLSDRLSVRRYGRTITGDVYYALKNGPVASGTRDILEGNDFLDDSSSKYASEYLEQIDKYNFKSILNVNEKVFSKTDLEILDLVYKYYGQQSHFELSDLSHEFPEWKRYESALEKGISTRCPIHLSDFFINPQQKYTLFDDNESDLEITKSIFQENEKILDAF